MPLDAINVEDPVAIPELFLQILLSAIYSIHPSRLPNTQSLFTSIHNTIYSL